MLLKNVLQKQPASDAFESRCSECHNKSLKNNSYFLGRIMRKHKDIIKRIQQRSAVEPEGGF